MQSMALFSNTPIIVNLCVHFEDKRIMPARVAWYQEGSIILFEVTDPLLLEEIKTASEEVWALAKEVREPVDMIFDYRSITQFPRGILPVVRDGHFTLPTLERVALVGWEPLVEMMMT